MSATLITPVVLTKDEEANIGRTLESLRWAKRVVVCDSGSQDATESIARSFENVVWAEHVWQGFGAQWRGALAQATIETEWVLALDADMQAPAALVKELESLCTDASINGVEIGFKYAIDGVILWGSFYPPQLRCFRTEGVLVGDRGHAHEFAITGRSVRARNRLIHDDRKVFERFVAAQVGYSVCERDMLLRQARSLSRRDALRRYCPFLPEIVGLAAYLRAGGPFLGAAARRYGLERLMFEAMLRYRLLQASQPIDQKRPE